MADFFKGVGAVVQLCANGCPPPILELTGAQIGLGRLSNNNKKRRQEVGRW